MSVDQKNKQIYKVSVSSIIQQKVDILGNLSVQRIGEQINYVSKLLKKLQKDPVSGTFSKQRKDTVSSLPRDAPKGGKSGLPIYLRICVQISHISGFLTEVPIVHLSVVPICRKGVNDLTQVRLYMASTTIRVTSLRQMKPKVIIFYVHQCGVLHIQQQDIRQAPYSKRD